MKAKFYGVLIAILFTNIVLQAQTIPNNGFENWTRTSSSILIGWGSLNWLSTLGLPETSTQTNDSYDGGSALRIETKLVGEDTLDGMSFTGSWPLNEAPQFGYAFTNRPSKLQGYYKFSSQYGDSCAFIVWFTKWNTSLNKEDSIGRGVYYGKSDSAYTHFEIPIIYYTSEAPDTAVVMLLASARSSEEVKGIPGNILTIDELSFDNSNGINEAIADNPLLVYPNPATDKITFGGLKNPNSELLIYDISGKEVFKTSINAEDLMVDTKSFTAGIYHYNIITDSGNKRSGKFIITK